jgi:hypothetical protein
MFDVKELLISLGLLSNTIIGTQDMSFYRKKLITEISIEYKIQSELKQLEYKKIWEEANSEKPSTFVNKWLKEEKAIDKINKLKLQQQYTFKKIKALKQIIEKDSLERIKIEPIIL